MCSPPDGGRSEIRAQLSFYLRSICHHSSPFFALLKPGRRNAKCLTTLRASRTRVHGRRRQEGHALTTQSQHDSGQTMLKSTVNPVLNPAHPRPCSQSRRCLLLQSLSEENHRSVGSQGRTISLLPHQASRSFEFLHVGSAAATDTSPVEGERAGSEDAQLLAAAYHITERTNERSNERTN